jgi:hypothetical protein
MDPPLPIPSEVERVEIGHTLFPPSHLFLLSNFLFFFFFSLSLSLFPHYHKLHAHTALSLSQTFPVEKHGKPTYPIQFLKPKPKPKSKIKSQIKYPTTSTRGE